jgi:hypothetical protein
MKNIYSLPILCTNRIMKLISLMQFFVYEIETWIYLITTVTSEFLDSKVIQSESGRRNLDWNLVIVVVLFCAIS